MERFAFKIDKVLKANLYRICRLCGIDNPDKVPILKNDTGSDVVDVDAEPEISKKINDLIGITVYKDDKMPQYVCTLCVDKINDFYEFREMCFSTDAQTRKLLGIKNVPKKNSQIKLEVKNEAPSTDKNDKNEKRGRKRKLEEVIETRKEIKEEAEKSISSKTVGMNKKKMRFSLSKQKNQVQAVTESSENVKSEVKDEPVFEVAKSSAAKANAAKINAATATKIADAAVAKSSDLVLESTQKLKQLCTICNQRFTTKAKLERHRIAEHNPIIPRHFCTTCDEEVKKSTEYKSHQLWHKLSKTPHTCGLCGETLLSVNLYTRHLSNHSQKLATPIMIFDRECSQCHETFVTNFLYNIHPCAIRTKKCGGCNRKMNTETDHQRHAASCDKTYLVPSKHIGGIVEAVRIKNENDVEAAAEGLNRNITVPLKMMPVVSLTRLSIEPQKDINKANTSSSIICKSKKSAKKGISKKDLKRVDDLLKSTMDTLVSIKHEPEINVDAELQSLTPQLPIPPLTANVSMEDNIHNDDYQNNDDDFQNQDDDSNHSYLNASLTPIVQLHTGEEINIKQEPSEECQQPKKNINEANEVNVKKELPDSAYEDNTGTKVPVLKLKITKEHGTLNSSLVNNSTELREKKKKKKKRKDAEKVCEQVENNDTTLTTLTTTTPENSTTQVSETAKMPLPGILHVKQERLDDGYYEGDSVTESTMIQQPEATIMTSIPMMQLQIANVSCGVDFEQLDAGKETENEITEQEEQQIEQQIEEEDVKPNIKELERLLANNKSQELLQEEEKDEEDEEAEDASKAHTTKQRQQPKKTIPKRVATKSTSKRPNANVKLSHIEQMPKIVSISSGVDMASMPKDNNDENESVSVSESEQYSTATSELFTAVRIKAEPRDDDYYEQNIETAAAEPMDYENDNETHTEIETEENMPYENEAISRLNKTLNNDNVNAAEEQAYINSIDFSNIRIKQEKDIDVSESQLTAQNYNGAIPNILINNNGDETELVAPIENESIDEDEEDDEEESEEEYDDEDQEMPAIEEKREYREIELPPLIDEAAVNETIEIATQSKCIQPSLGLMISSVCSQASQEMETFTPTEANCELEISEKTETPEKSTIENDFSELEHQIVEQTEIQQVKTFETGFLITKVTTEQQISNENTDYNLQPQIVESVSQISEQFKQPQASQIGDSSSAHFEQLQHTATADDSLVIAASNSPACIILNNSKDSIAINETTASATISGIITEYTESSLKALPVLETSIINNSNESHETYSETQLTTSIDEEQQNILNQEMCESHSNCSTTNIMPTINTLPTIVETLNSNSTPGQVESYLEDISSSSLSDFSNIGNENSTNFLKIATVTAAINEETENLLNENVDVSFNLLQHDAGLNMSSSNSQIVTTQQEQQTLLLDNSNVNEIAENNNNANIERELLDDVSSHHNIQMENEHETSSLLESVTESESPTLGDSLSTASNAVEQQGNAQANA